MAPLTHRTTTTMINIIIGLAIAAIAALFMADLVTKTLKACKPLRPGTSCAVAQFEVTAVVEPQAPKPQAPKAPKAPKPKAPKPKAPKPKAPKAPKPQAPKAPKPKDTRTVAELRAACKAAGLRGYSQLKRNDLLTLLAQA